MAPEPLALFLRADAGPKIGSGHTARLLALGEAWISAGGRATMLTRRPSPPLRARADAAGIALVDVPASYPDSADARFAAAAVSSASPRPWIAIDGYNFDAEYMASARAVGARVLALDDSIRLDRYPVDVLIDQNAGAETRDYPIPPDSLSLLGPRWALLRPAPAARRRQRRKDAEEPRILVSFGGADPGDATRTALLALKKMKRPCRAVVVVGPDNPRAAELRRLASGTSIRIEEDADMQALMAEADLALLSGGVTMLEACSVGLAVLVVTVADNQEPGSAALSEIGAVRLLGRIGSVSEKRIADALDDLIEDGAARAALARVARDTVDGMGARRAAEAMLAFSAERLSDSLVRFRRAEESDVREVWRIANDPLVRKNSLDPRPILWNEHMNWFASRLRDPAGSIFVADVGCVAGHFRLSDCGPGGLEVHFYVHPAFRGRGLGTLLLKKAQEFAFKRRGIAKVVGRVLPGNNASTSAFRSSGFAALGEVRDGGRRCQLFESARSANVSARKGGLQL